MAGRSAVVAEVMDGRRAVSEVAAELKQLEEALAIRRAPTRWTRLMARFGDVQARFDNLGGYALEARAREILAGLGFSQEMMDGDVGALSGGWKMRVALARILLMRPDAMLLDEPSNHLDIESSSGWRVPEGLRGRAGDDLARSRVHEPHRQPGHRDRRRRADQLLGQPTTSTSSSARSTRQQAGAVRAPAGDAGQGDRFIERFKAQASKAAQVQSRVKKLDKIEKVEPPKRRKTLTFEFPPAPRSGEDVVKIEKLCTSATARA
jgi:ATPase subunit of ABC transporter with duplicated ATPase domains